ncbi:MAG TPA: glycosyltransferase [Bryobacteraceae bacterium]|nr:glycosyltransferase [Bryobacteraceae bacterium]
MLAVSVVMPVFNAARFLGEAVESILAQSFEEFELIAADDGSTDESAEILERYARDDRRLRVFRCAHEGLPAILNFGCAQAEGKYIARMDADDIALPSRFERQIEFLDKHPRVAILGTQLERIREDGTSMGFTNHPLEHAQIAANMQKFCCIHHPTVMMRTETVRALGGYREAFHGAEDHDLWLRAAEQFELANLPDVLLRYRLHTEAVSFRELEEQVIAAMGADLAARLRRAGVSEPFAAKKRITRQDLKEAGLSETSIHRSLENARNWYRVRNIQPSGPPATG